MLSDPAEDQQISLLNRKIVYLERTMEVVSIHTAKSEGVSKVGVATNHYLACPLQWIGLCGQKMIDEWNGTHVQAARPTRKNAHCFAVSMAATLNGLTSFGRVIGPYTRSPAERSHA